MRFIDNVLKCRAYVGKYVLPCVGAPHRHRVFGEIQKSGDVPGRKTVPESAEKIIKLCIAGCFPDLVVERLV